MTSTLTWVNLFAVMGGGVVGCVLRWLAGVWLNNRWSGFPLGTLFVNCVGGLLIGAALVWFQRMPNETLRLLVVTGVLGGFTTFSSYSVESLIMLQRGEWLLAMTHTAAHVLGAIICAALGFRLCQLIFVE
jgi:CrcB protein